MASNPVTTRFQKLSKLPYMVSTTQPEKLFRQLIPLQDNPGHISTHVEELPVPEPGPGQVLVRLIVSFKITSQIPGARDTDIFPAFRRLPQRPKHHDLRLGSTTFPRSQRPNVSRDLPISSSTYHMILLTSFSSLLFSSLFPSHHKPS